MSNSSLRVHWQGLFLGLRKWHLNRTQLASEHYDDGLHPDVSVAYFIRLQHLQDFALRDRNAASAVVIGPRRSEEKPEMNLPSFPNIDLFSAGINALNGVLVARNPSHNRGYTLAGLLIMAFFGGIGGGVARDVLLNDIPSPLKNPPIFSCVF
jgi:hypothetical protein